MLWANLLWRERRSESHLIESVWTSSTPAAVSRAVIADPCISIALVKDSAGARVVVSGARTKPYNSALEAGYACISIRLKPGVFLKGLPAGKLVDNTCTFPADSASRFRFAETHLRFPDFDHAELLVEQLQDLGYLAYETPGGPSPAGRLSARTRSRRTQRITGLTPYQLYQLQRMHQVLRLLKEGMPAADVASELAFTDQSHLTRAVKHFFGYTPKQLPDLPQTP